MFRVNIIILQYVQGGQSVVLTSHSMEECEALCSRYGAVQFDWNKLLEYSSKSLWFPLPTPC